MTGRKRYLEGIPLAEAWERFNRILTERGFFRPEEEEVTVDEALGRVASRTVRAVISSPHYHAAAMDGVAVRAEDTYGARETAPLRLRLGTQAVEVDTGDPMPEDKNAVIMVEDVRFLGEEVEITAPVFPWQNVRLLGEDIAAGDVVLTAGQVVGPYESGALLAAGHTRVWVRRKPIVAFIPTGDEIVLPGQPLQKGDIVEFNSRVLGGMVRQAGGAPLYLPVVPDDREKIRAAVLSALERADVVAVIAGSSAGRGDFTAAIVAELGEVVCHGVAIKPGKPVILGVVAGKPVIGVPGYPVSAALTCQLFLLPLLYRKLGLAPPERKRLVGTLTRRLPSPMGVEEFVRARAGRVGERYLITPISRGAGLIMTMVRADGLIRIPASSQGYEAGEEVEMELWRPQEEIDRALLFAGSHDLLLDILDEGLREMGQGWSLRTANVGSLGGLQALRRGEAHLAGCHLLDPESGEYNLSYIRRFLGDREVKIITLAAREQGLVVAPGNPLQIRGLADLREKKARFINRQRGSGTRILLDHLLAQEGIKPDEIEGYEREEFSHLAVAAAVAGGAADAGMAIRAAAEALGLDFVPVGYERYDLVIPASYWEDERVQVLVSFIRSEEFRRRSRELPGYDFSQSGREIPL